MPAAPNPDRALTGLALRLFAIFCLASMAALIKLAEAHGASLVEILFHRQLWAVPVVMAWLAAGDGLGTIRTTRFGAHVGRTAVGLAGMVFNFGAILLLPLAEATTLSFTVPIFATILGALALRETVGRHRWSAVVIGFAGVLIVAQPSGGHFPLIGTLVGLTAAFFVATVAILLRQLGKTESAGTTVFWFSLLSVPPLAIAYAFDFHPHDWTVWAMLLAIGLVGGVGQLALTGALRYAPVSTVVPMDYSSLVWATLYGWTFFGMLPTPYTWIGAPIIIASGLYIVWREQRRGAPVSAADTPA
ncbi:DMT family transporter [Sphingomonas sp. LB-2]|uniref:DMT family transporter n=1 Tax=Sphingomonas caeni TaxID=2984949 RepID=UPI002232B702|nr:DMT family transporter [Sphingomonas caeni]MCW3848980.1 DMT family transporter [Sphingomonas caeni]